MTFRPVFINFRLSKNQLGRGSRKTKSEDYQPGSSQNSRALPSRTFPLSDQEVCVCYPLRGGDWETFPVLTDGKRAVGKKKYVGPKSKE